MNEDTSSAHDKLLLRQRLDDVVLNDSLGGRSISLPKS
jgi:hypothetical protein